MRKLFSFSCAILTLLLIIRGIMWLCIFKNTKNIDIAVYWVCFIATVCLIGIILIPKKDNE